MAAPEELFARFRQHADADALAAVFDALAPSLLLVAAHVAPAGCEAEDLVQATFLGAMEDAQRWDPSRPVMPWLIGILINRARNDRRQRGRKLDAARLPQLAEPSPLDATAANEVAAQVSAALASLPRQLRQTLSLRLVHGLTPTEIAHTLGCPVATAKTRLQRGMEWLRKLLPVGIATSVAGMVTTGKGLAAVRALVLGEAKGVVTGVVVAGVTAGAIAGGLAMKKMVIAVVVVLSLAGLWALMPGPIEPMRAASTDSMQTAALQAVPGSPTGNTTIAKDPEAIDRVAPPSTVASTTGSAELQLLWKGEGTPATGLALEWYRGENMNDGGYGTTDATGHLRLADLAAGDYRLFSPLVQHAFTIRVGAVTRERVEVEPFVRFDGIVVDGEGRGVAGAELLRHGLDEWAGLALPRRLAISGHDGRFHGCADNGGWIWAAKGGLVPSTPQLMGRGEGAGLRLVLAHAGTAVHGTVVTADGSPAPNALLAIASTASNGGIAAPIVQNTDERGHFAIDQLAPGEHLLVARAVGHAATLAPFTVVAGIEQQLEIRLLRGATVFGTVQVAGRSSPCSVSARPVWGMAPRSIAAWCIDRVQGDKEGNYRLEHVPPGTTTVEAPAINDGAQQLQLTEGEERRCDFAPTSTSEIHGRIVDANDQPVTDWWVQAFSQQSGVGASSAPTDKQGRFRIDGLAGGAYLVTAMPTSLSSSEPWLEVVDVRPGPGELLLRARYTLQDGGHFMGIAVGGSGTPATDVTALYRLAGREQAYQHKAAKVRDGGQFEFGPLPPGSYEVRLFLPGQGHLRLGVHELLPRARVDLGTARMPGAGRLELRFTRPDGTAMTPVDLVASDGIGNFSSQFDRNGDGVLQAQQMLPAGTYQVTAWGEDFARVQQDAVVVAGRTTRTDVVVIAASPVHFELQRPAGVVGERWVARVRVRILDANRQLLATSWLSIDTAGSFPWTRGLLPGSYTYEAAQQPDGEPVHGAFSVSGGAEAHRVEIQLPAKAK